MTRPAIEPLTEQNLPEFAAFLHLHLNPARSAADWQAGLSVGWLAERPNHGFLLRDDGKVVGGIGAYYAMRKIAGRNEKFCNITSWCVLDAYRQQSMRLAMAVVSQPGYHFTDFSPTKVVGATLRFFKFQPLDERQIVIPNLPWPASGGLMVLHRPREIEAALQGDALQVYRDHAVFPWLRHALLGRPGAWCHVIYKTRLLKGLPMADILHASNHAVLQTGLRQLASHLLTRGFVTTQVEYRWLAKRPRASALRTGFNQKLYLSSSLGEADIDYLYSETVALDL